MDNTFLLPPAHIRAYCVVPPLRTPPPSLCYDATAAGAAQTK